MEKLIIRMALPPLHSRGGQKCLYRQPHDPEYLLEPDLLGILVRSDSELLVPTEVSGIQPRRIQTKYLSMVRQNHDEYTSTGTGGTTQASKSNQHLDTVEHLELRQRC